MATIYNGKIAKYEEGSYTIDTLWDDLEAAFDWYSVSGTDSDKKFKISDKVELQFLNFANPSSENSPEIKANVNGVSISIFTSNYAYWYSSSRAYRIIVSNTGDIEIKIPSTHYDYDTVHSNADFAFAVVAVQNTLDDSKAGYGVYVPYSNGGVSSSGALATPFNHTPKYLITDDTTEDITNTGRSGSTASTILEYVINENAKITALAPICANCSECVSTNSYTMIIGNSYRNGYTELNGEKYYCDGGFCMLEGAV